MSQQISKETVNVLVVTSDSSALKEATQALSRDGYKVHHADCGPDSLLVLKQRVIDVMLADAVVADMPGIHVAGTASRMFPDLCVVMMAENGSPEAVRAALQHGAFDFISKPLDPVRLLSVVERSLKTKHAEARKLSEERSKVLFSAIRALAAAIDAKSYFTATHSSRVTSLCLSAGEALGFNATDMATLELAAQIHDIGKIGTPDEILDKPGSLTDVEWVDILRHPDVGSSILSHVPALSHVASIVRHHHERYDGTGYPDGLRGDAIPLMSRIIAVADAYEAMTTDRPYRSARSHSEAIRELRANAGAQFDPTILEHFIAAADDLEVGVKAA